MTKMEQELSHLQDDKCLEELVLYGAQVFPLDEYRHYAVIENDVYTAVFNYADGWYRAHLISFKDGGKTPYVCNYVDGTGKKCNCGDYSGVD